MNLVNLRRMRVAALLLFVGAAPTGCVTVAKHRREIAAAHAAADAAMLAAQSAGQAAADARAEVGALREDLNRMRTDFGAKITAFESRRITLPTRFDFNRAELKEEMKPDLVATAGLVLSEAPDALVVIRGYADRAGSKAYNRELSRRRAETVRDFLATQGMQPAAMVVIGEGDALEKVPGASKNMPGAELNRRVVITIDARGQAPSNISR